MTNNSHSSFFGEGYPFCISQTVFLSGVAESVGFGENICRLFQRGRMMGGRGKRRRRKTQEWKTRALLRTQCASVGREREKERKHTVSTSRSDSLFPPARTHALKERIERRRSQTYFCLSSSCSSLAAHTFHIWLADWLCPQHFWGRRTKKDGG